MTTTTSRSPASAHSRINGPHSGALCSCVLGVVLSSVLSSALAQVPTQAQSAPQVQQAQQAPQRAAQNPFYSQQPIVNGQAMGSTVPLPSQAQSQAQGQFQGQPQGQPQGGIAGALQGLPPIPAPRLPGNSRAGEGLPPEIFNEAVNSQVPLSPGQVREVLRLEEQVRRAAAVRTGPMPSPTQASVRLSFAPGRTPHVLRLDYNTVTSIVFTDQTGAPWPIQAYSVADSLFTTTPSTAGGKDAPKTHIFTISPKARFAQANVSFQLEGAPAPIVMVVMSDQKEVDYRLDVTMTARGPNAQTPRVESAPLTGQPMELVSALDGITPEGSIKLNSSSSEVQAWLHQNRLIVRTNLDLISPVDHPFSMLPGPDGTKVYYTKRAEVVVLLKDGRTHSVRFTGFPPDYDAALRRASVEGK
jgi:intracellular multiplication protein IcmK